MRLLVPSATPLCTAVLRAPSAGLAMQYEAAARRAMRCLRVWVDGAHQGQRSAGQRVRVGGGQSAESPPPLLSLPGAGAAELQLSSLCTAAAADDDADDADDAAAAAAAADDDDDDDDGAPHS